VGGRHPHPEYNRLAAIAPVGAEVACHPYHGTITSYAFLGITAFEVEVPDIPSIRIHVPIDDFVRNWRIVKRPSFKKITI